MKTALRIMTLVFLMSTPAVLFAGGDAGNGGDAVVCFNKNYQPPSIVVENGVQHPGTYVDETGMIKPEAWDHVESVQVLDYYEAARTRMGNINDNDSNLEELSNLTMEETVAFVQNKTKVLPDFYKRWKGVSDRFSNRTLWVFVEAVLEDINDSVEPYLYPQNCIKVQTAVRKGNQLFVNKLIWDRMDEAQRGLLQIHEELYYIAIGMGHVNSSRVRVLLYHLLSKGNSTDNIRYALRSGGFGYYNIYEIIEDALLNSNFSRIESGYFTMGSRNGWSPGVSDDAHRDDDEFQYDVLLTKDYYIQTTEVTQAQWVKVMGSNPSKHQEQIYCENDYEVRDGISLCPNHPIENVSWGEIKVFIQKLNDLQITVPEGERYAYRLPTEAEWEHATRGAQWGREAYDEFRYQEDKSTDAYFFGRIADGNLRRYAFYRENENEYPVTHKIASKEANPVGLFDVYGNVWEWVEDVYGPYPNIRWYYNAIDPIGSVSGTDRVYRGGSAATRRYYHLRSANRNHGPENEGYNFVGFRLVKTN